MTKYTTNDDARVAEKVGYTFWEDDNGGRPLVYCWSPDHPRKAPSYRKNLRRRTGKNITAELRYFTDFEPPKFLTDPTFESDGIVLRWVQGQGHTVFFAWWLAIKLAMSKRDKHYPSDFEVMQNYKPGMYAQALLEVK